MLDNNIEVSCYTCRFFINTQHDAMLEFVLEDVETRSKRGQSYGETLWDMLKNAVENEPNVRVKEYSVYGHISYVLEADTIDKLTYYTNICSVVVNRWICKYRINHMRKGK